MFQFGLSTTRTIKIILENYKKSINVLKLSHFEEKDSFVLLILIVNMKSACFIVYFSSGDGQK